MQQRRPCRPRGQWAVGKDQEACLKTPVLEKGRRSLRLTFSAVRKPAACRDSGLYTVPGSHRLTSFSLSPPFYRWSGAGTDRGALWVRGEGHVTDRHFISEERRNLWKFCDTRSFLLLIKLALLPLIGYTYILHDGFGRNGNRRAIQWNLCHKLDHCQEQRWLQLKPMQCEKVKRD